MLWTAVFLGLSGSLHCVAMCGPIALALPISAKEKRALLVQSIFYNLGRISTYTLMGFFFGWVGWGIALAGYQNLLSIGIGMCLIIAAFTSISVEQKIFKSSNIAKALNWVKNRLSQLLQIKNTTSAYRIGLLNGLLPCGLVYIALAGAVATSHYLLGGFFMMAFGFGTLPLMLGLMYFGKSSRNWSRYLRRLSPYVLVAFGLFLIYRGMILEIPVTLSFWEEGNFPVMCH